MKMGLWWHLGIHLQENKLFKQSKKTLKKMDVNLIDVARARIHVTNIEEWKPIGRAHSE